MRQLLRFGTISAACLQGLCCYCADRCSHAGPVENESHLEDLPAVLVINVLSYLDTRCIVRAARAHRNLHAVVMRNAFWAGIYILRWRRSDEKQGFQRVRVFAAKYLSAFTKQANVQRDSADRPKRSVTVKKEPIDWTALYRERHVVERNWASAKAVITTLNGHNGTVTCLQFSDSRLVRALAHTRMHVLEI